MQMHGCEYPMTMLQLVLLQFLQSRDFLRVWQGRLCVGKGAGSTGSGLEARRAEATQGFRNGKGTTAHTQLTPLDTAQTNAVEQQTCDPTNERIILFTT